MKRSYASMLNDLGEEKGQDKENRCIIKKTVARVDIPISSNLQKMVPRNISIESVRNVRSSRLALITGKGTAKALSRRSTPLGCRCWCSTTISSSTSRASITHLLTCVLTWGLGWWSSISTLLTRKLAWRLLVSHRPG